MPRAERQRPVYIQIQDHYRDAIRSGQIANGERLPALPTLAEEWECSVGTAAKAINGLGVEGYVVTSTQGTYASLGKGAAAGADLAMRRVPGGSSGQRNEVTAAERILAPVYVAELLGLDPVGAVVARREWITYTGPQPTRLSVGWWAGELADRVPELGQLEDGDTLEWIRDATGRAAAYGRDWYEAREADVREAQALGIRPGDTVLASTYTWSDDEGVLQYGEFVLPRKKVVSISYAIDAED